MPENSITVEIESEVLAIRMFIAHIETGHYRFVQPGPEDLDFDAMRAFEGRTKSFTGNAKRWMSLFQNARESQEFKQLTEDLYSKILYWRSKNLVDGQATVSNILDQTELAREHVRELKKKISALTDDNIRLAEEVAKFKRPPFVQSEENNVKGEE